MFFDVTLRIKDAATGIRTELDIRLEVKQAESGLYIASNPLVSPLLGSGIAPRYAILEYLGNLLYSTTVEAEMATGTHEHRGTDNAR